MNRCNSGPDQEPTFLALHMRSDGVLVGSLASTTALYEIDPKTGDWTQIGDAGVEIRSFAEDPVTGQVYALAGDDLYEIDLFTFKKSFIGTIDPDLKVFGIAGINCLADFNTAGELDVLDFVAFQLAWQAGDLAADINADGALDLLDFIAFQSLFQAGC